MSRCFPFPPPGYEKRARTDDTDLLIKENRKEKKHKKDKKDKEKREGKERKGKERSKEKKDRKEKKDKERDKDKTLTSAEKKVEKQQECYNGENVGPDSRQNVEIKDSKYVQELARRIKDEDRATGSQMVQNAVMDQRRATLLERAVAGNIANRFKEGEKIKDEKKINGFINHIDPRVSENEIISNNYRMDQTGVEGKAKPVDQNNVDKMEPKEKNKQNGGESKSEKRKDRDREKRSKSKDKDRKSEKEKKKKVKKTEQSKEQPKLKEGIKDTSCTFIAKPSNHMLKMDAKVSIEGNLDIHKDVEMKKEQTKEQPKIIENGKPSPGTCIFESVNRLKEGTEISSVDGILGKRKELKMKKEPISKDGSKVMPMISKVKLSNHVNAGTASSNGVGNLGKRKEPEMNGNLDDYGIRPSKSQRLVSPLHPVVENGGKIEPCTVPEQGEPERQGAASNLRVEIIGHAANGSVDAQAANITSKRPSRASATLQVNENGEVCGKPPHPDSKYLNHILSVPTTEESSAFDDQDWLFSCNKLPSKTPKAVSPKDRTAQVWAQSLKIESADIYALPYVIPY